MKYDMIVSDFDGTLGNPDGSINPETVKAIKGYIERGGIFAIASGRMDSSVKYVFDINGINGVGISSQGAKIDDYVSGKTLFKSGINYHVAGDIVKEMEKDGLTVTASIDGVIYYDKVDKWTDNVANFVDTDSKKVESLYEYIYGNKKDVLKFCSYASPLRVKRLTAKYNKKYSGKVVFNNGSKYIVEVINPTCSKGKAVEFLSKYYGVPFDKIMTVGDSTNDMELVGGAWHGVAVGGCMKKLKKVAKEITVVYKDDPIKYLIEKYC